MAKKRQVKVAKQSVGNQRSTEVQRSIIKASIPRAYMSVSSKNTSAGDPIIVVKGMEVVAEVSSTSYFNYSVQFNKRINPADPTLFPRLSVLANPFDRFRLRRMVARFHCGCPSTTQGAIGMVVLRDSSDQLPSTMVELAEYATSVASTVSVSSECRYTGDANEPFLVTSLGLTGTDTGDRWAGLSRFVVVTDKTSTTGVFLGYISLEYEFEMAGMRPATRAVAAGTIAPFSYAANTFYYTSPFFKTIKGVYDIAQDAVDVYNQWNNGTYGPPRRQQSLTAGTGKYAASGYLPIGPAPSSSQSWVKLGTTPPAGDVYWINPSFRVQGIGYEGSDHKTEEEFRKAFSPQVTGDCGVSLIGQDLTDLSKPAELLAYFGKNAVGSTSLAWSFPVQFIRPYRLGLTYGGVDNRTVYEGTFDLATISQ